MSGKVKSGSYQTPDSIGDGPSVGTSGGGKKDHNRKKKKGKR